MRLTDTQIAALQDARDRDIQEMLTILERSAIQFLLPEDSAFPQTLRHQPDPPFALFVRGAVLRDELTVAVVGTRRMTDYGRRATELIVEELVRHGVTIVSGLALGIDGMAHQVCVDASGRTIAVLPGGLDDASLVPRQHLPLSRQIQASGGTLLSEHAPGTPTHPFHFLHRNRLIAALADAVVIIEADHDSGALVTARLALECGREVLAVPGSIWSAASRGTNELIKNGARPCTGADDLFAALGFRNPAHARQIADARASLPVSPDEERILNVLNEPRSVDDVARLLNEPIAKTNALISLLELKGRVISVGPRLFVKIL